MLSRTDLGNIVLYGIRYKLERFIGVLSNFVIPPNTYFIREGYCHRRFPRYFDDTGEDEWQKEVYLFARQLMEEKKLQTVYDIGCGSGYKLVHYLGGYETTGFDLAPTIQRVRTTYPDRKWQVADFRNRHLAPPDLLVCADVIEHVKDPDALMTFIRDLSPEHILLSTPNRELLYEAGSRYLQGPPWNLCHIREWNDVEFAAYVSRYFKIVEHTISNREQGTQMLLCTNARSILDAAP